MTTIPEAGDDFLTHYPTIRRWVRGAAVPGSNLVSDLAALYQYFGGTLTPASEQRETITRLEARIAELENQLATHAATLAQRMTTPAAVSAVAKAAYMAEGGTAPPYTDELLDQIWEDMGGSEPTAERAAVEAAVWNALRELTDPTAAQEVTDHD